MLFVIFVYDLDNSTKVFDPVLFPEDTNLLCSDNIKSTLFERANEELIQINDWFLANKLSLNVEKTKYILFHQLTDQDVGVLYKTSTLINYKCLQSIYFSFTYFYMNYANIACASTDKTNLKKLFGKQKQAARTLFNQDRFVDARPLLKTPNVLNVYQINFVASTSVHAQDK